jgi:hypothetical protein
MLKLEPGSGYNGFYSSYIREPIMPRKSAQPDNENDLRPSRQAFKPAGKEDIKNDLILAGVLLAGFFLGLLANIFGNFSSFLTASERGLNNSVTPLPLQLLVYFGYPLFLIGSLYYLYHAWKTRKKTQYFKTNHLQTDAEITHLWKVPPSGSGKHYFVGYRYNGDHSAYMEVDVYMFKRLQIGAKILVNYLPEDPAVSFPELPGQKAL